MIKNPPKISVITPSYNQGKFIEKTVNSVLSQKYPNLEYLVMDGGSTDETLKILKKYSNQIIWTSKKDKGQSSAINEGLKKSTGEIICYLNSDDYLEEGALNKVADFFRKNPRAYWVTGKCRVVDQNNSEVRKIITLYKNIFLKYALSKSVFNIIQFVSQPSTFWRRELIEKIGYFDEKLHYDMDYDFWLKAWSKYPLYFIDEYLSSYRVHPSSKAVSSPETQFKVEYEIISRYTDSKALLFLHKIHSWLAVKAYRTFYIHK